MFSTKEKVEYSQLMVYNGIHNIDDWGILMEIETLFNEIVSTLRKFTNSVNRNDKSESNYIIEHLNDILYKLNFLQRDNDETKELEKRMSKEVHRLLKAMTVKTNNIKQYKSKLQRNIDYLTWVNR